MSDHGTTHATPQPADRLLLLDASGTILAASPSSERDALPTSLRLEHAEVGANFFTHCKTAIEPGTPVAPEAIQGVLSVARGVSDEFAIEYPDQASNGRRWFELRAGRLHSRGALALWVSHRNITPHKEREAALRAKDERIRVALAAGPIVLFNQDRNLRYTWVGNPALGLRTEEAIGRSDEELLGAEAAKPLTTVKRRVLESGRGERQELRVDRAGAFGWYYLAAEPLRDDTGGIVGITCVAIDVTEHKRAEAALRESEAIRHQAAESAPDALCAVDRDYRLLFHNQRHQRLLAARGRRPVAVGESMLSPEEPTGQARWQEIYDRAFRGEVFHFETEEPTIEGAASVLEHHLSPLRDAHGTTIGALVVSHDVTERRQAEDSLRASREQLRTLAGRLESVREEERSSVAREIHDVLAQELTRLKMDIAWLQRRMARPIPADEQPALLAKLKVMSEVADTAMVSVQTIATGLRPVVLDTLGLAAAVEWAGRDFQDRTGVTCRTDVTEEDLAVDRERATAAFRILQESLTNITRHAGATQVDIQLSAGRMDDTLGPVPDPRPCLTLCVRDNGRGISPARIRDPRSLGLLGMRERAEILGGTCEIVRLPAGGTEVRLRIPLPLPQPPAP